MAFPASPLALFRPDGQPLTDAAGRAVHWTALTSEGFRADYRTLYRDVLAAGGGLVAPAPRARTHEGAPLLHTGFRAGDAALGYALLREDEPGSLRLLNTALVPDARGRGLYAAFLEALLPAARAAGFSGLVSRHRADHNALLIPKLRAGFVLAGLRVDPRFGLQAELVCPFSADRRAMLAYRTGSRAWDERLARRRPPTDAGRS